jgi:hypothetical protein
VARLTDETLSSSDSRMAAVRAHGRQGPACTIKLQRSGLSCKRVDVTQRLFRDSFPGALHVDLSAASACRSSIDARTQSTLCPLVLVQLPAPRWPCDLLLSRLHGILAGWGLLR